MLKYNSNIITAIVTKLPGFAVRGRKDGKFHGHSAVRPRYYWLVFVDFPNFIRRNYSNELSQTLLTTSSVVQSGKGVSYNFVCCATPKG